MTRVLKFIHSETEGASPYGRDLLESFPDKAPFKPVFAPLPLPEEENEAEAELIVDPELIRQEVLAEARLEAEQKVQEAYQEGLARGTAAGLEAFQASLGQCAEALTAAGDALKETHVAFLEHLEPQVLELVKHMVAKVIDIELKTNPEIIQRTVSRALALMVNEHEVTLALNPQDLEAIRKHQVQLLESFPPIETLNLVADDSVQPGGCIASSDSTGVDGRIDSLLAQVLDSLTE